MSIRAYPTGVKKLPGTNYSEVYKKAFSLYQEIKRKSKRRPYVRSAYFKKTKIFLGIFWQHLHEKRIWRDKIRRIKYFPAAIDLIQNSKFSPITKEDSNKPSEILHRFTGITKDNRLFYVQIKENKKSAQKYLISVFPEK